MAVGDIRSIEAGELEVFLADVAKWVRGAHAKGAVVGFRSLSGVEVYGEEDGWALQRSTGVVTLEIIVDRGYPPAPTGE
jgi:hypothetical protein